MIAISLQLPLVFSSHTMSPTTINEDAFLKLKDLSAWVSDTKEFKKEQENLFRCVDEGRHVKVAPLLEDLGFDKIKVIWLISVSGIQLRCPQGYGYSIWRVTGKISLKPTPHYKSLFFPLSISSGSDSAAGEVQAAGEVLTPGIYVPFTTLITLDSQLDCLIVYLPETGVPSAAGK